jgi:hypothetical protein
VENTVENFLIWHSKAFETTAFERFPDNKRQQYFTRERKFPKRIFA